MSKEFWGTWNDNMGTGIMLSSGQCDNKGSRRRRSASLFQALLSGVADLVSLGRRAPTKGQEASLHV